MKKVLLMNYLYKPNIGGVENSISEISKILTDKGYLVDIVTSNRNNENDSHLDSTYIIDGANIYRFNYEFGKLAFLRTQLNSILLLKSLKQINKYDYIVSRNSILVVSSKLAGLKKIKYIPPEVTFYSSKDQRNIKSPKSILSFYTKVIIESLALLLSDEVYVFSDSMIEQTHNISLGLKKPNKVEPGINLNKFIPAKLEKKLRLRKFNNIPNNKKVLLALGRFSELKQYDLAISAMQYLSDEYLLLIVGSGSEIENYKKLISRYKLNHKVRIMEPTKTPEDMYQLSDAFLMTSKYESFGQTILEAYASQLKIIGFSKKSGVNTNIESILTDYDQLFLVDKQTSLELSIRIDDAFSDYYTCKESTLIENSTLIKRYSWDRFIKRIGIK